MDGADCIQLNACEYAISWLKKYINFTFEKKIRFAENYIEQRKKFQGSAESKLPESEEEQGNEL
jgi:hypothetical protein